MSGFREVSVELVLSKGVGWYTTPITLRRPIFVVLHTNTPPHLEVSREPAAFVFHGRCINGAGGIGA